MCFLLYLENAENKAKFWGKEDKLLLSPANRSEDVLELLRLSPAVCEIRWPNRSKKRNG